MNYKNVLIGSLVLLVSITSCGKEQAQTAQRQTPTPTVPVKTISFEEVDLHAVYPAILRGEEDIDIKPQVNGFIEKVYVDEGELVKAGQPLFKINSPATQTALEQAQAQYNTAKLDVERMRPLAEKNIISDVQLQAYENAFSAAKAALDQAKATMGWVTVTSPVNGTVGTIPMRLGSLVNSTSVLTTVANTSHIMANFSMNEKDLYAFLDKWPGKTKEEKIKNMPAVQFVLSNGRVYEEKGQILTISGVINQTTGSVNIRASFPNEAGLLLSGTSGKIVIPNHLDSAIVVPQRATFSQQDKTLIFKVTGDSLTQKVIEVESTPDGKSYVVTNGLNTGDKVVTSGILRLRNGQKINVQ